MEAVADWYLNTTTTGATFEEEGKVYLTTPRLEHLHLFQPKFDFAAYYLEYL